MGYNRHIMIDLETLGTKPGSIILSIGAVRFSRNKIESSFHIHIKPESCEEAGLKADTSTMLWWLNQSDEARKKLLIGQKNAEKLSTTLLHFSSWMYDQGRPDRDQVFVWGNGASFDLVLLSSAYKAVGFPIPWIYPNERCYRTVKALSKRKEIKREGTHHDALADAIHQAKHLMKIRPNL